MAKKMVKNYMVITETRLLLPKIWLSVFLILWKVKKCVNI